MRENREITRQSLEEYYRNDYTSPAEKQEKAIKIIEQCLSDVGRVAFEPRYVTMLKQMNESDKMIIMDAFNLTELTPEVLNEIVRL